jgi:hypothetical protein
MNVAGMFKLQVKIIKFNLRILFKDRSVVPLLILGRCSLCFSFCDFDKIIFCGAGNQAQGFVHAKQALYH